MKHFKSRYSSYHRYEVSASAARALKNNAAGYSGSITYIRSKCIVRAEIIF